MPGYERILLVDDHAIAREGAALHLRALNPALQVVHAASVDEAIAAVQMQPPELVFLDLRFEDDAGGDLRGGLRLLRWLKASPAHDHIPVMVMSGETLDRQAVEDLLALGAAGYLAKGKAGGAQIFRLALEVLQAGGVFIHGARPTAVNAGSTPRAPPMPELIPSHQRVLVRHVRGMPYKSIARELGIAEATVKEYISDLCRRFKVRNAKALIYEIARSGVVLEDKPR